MRRLKRAQVASTPSLPVSITVDQASVRAHPDDAASGRIFRLQSGDVLPPAPTIVARASE